MSTTFEWRDEMSGAMERRAPRRAVPTELAATRSEPIPLRRQDEGRKHAPATNRAVALRLRQRLDRARLAAVAIVGLSVLGILYLTQISHVARYGYLLSDIQRDQDRVARENQLLEYQIAAAHNLGQAEDLAEKSYGMKPYVQLTPVTAAGGAKLPQTKGTPAARYITVQRPATTAPTPQPMAEPVGLIDRLLNQLVGIGKASAGR